MPRRLLAPALFLASFLWTPLFLAPVPLAAGEPAPLRVGFLVVDGVYNSELIAPYDIFHHTVFHTDPGMELFIVSPDGKPVTSFEGIEIGAHYSFGNAPTIDVLVVPSAEHSMDSDLEDEAMMTWVREVGAEADYLVSLCDGAFVLAAAELLDDVASTTFPGDLDRYEEMFPHLDVRRGVSFVHDGRALTSQGGARSYDVAMHLVDYLYGEKVAQGVARGMVIEWPDPTIQYAVERPGERGKPDVTSLECADPNALRRAGAMVQHRDGPELHQVWTLVDHPGLWGSAPADHPALIHYRSRAREAVGDVGPLGLIQANRRMFSWLEREHPAERAINRAIESGTVGRHRPMSCLESQTLGYQASRFPLFEQPTEIVTLVLRRGEGEEARIKVYMAADGDPIPPKPTHALQAIETDLAAGWRLWGTFHNHTFELNSERGWLALAAPSANDLQVFQFLHDRYGLERAFVSDGFSTLDLAAEDFETLAAAIAQEQSDGTANEP